MFGSSSLLAIDIGEYSVKVLDLKWSQTADLSKHASSYIVDSEGGQEEGNVALRPSSFALQQSLKTHKLKNSKVITSVALGDAILREINIEHAFSDHEVEGAIGVELGESLPFTLDQVYFDFLPNPHDAEGNHYLVAASRKEIVDEKTNTIKEVLKKNQLKKIEVDIDAFAFDRLVSKVYESTLRDNKIILLVDVGYKRTKFYFYASEGLVYNREQQIGGFQVTEAVSEVFDLPISDAEHRKHFQATDEDFQELVVAPFAVSFSEQLNLVLDFYDAARKNDKEIEKIVICGGGACLSGFLDKLSSYIDYKIELIDIGILGHKNANDLKENGFSANFALCSALLCDGVSI